GDAGGLDPLVHVLAGQHAAGGVVHQQPGGAGDLGRLGHGQLLAQRLRRGGGRRGGGILGKGEAERGDGNGGDQRDADGVGFHQWGCSGDFGPATGGRRGPAAILTTGYSRTGCGAPKPSPATRALRSATPPGGTGPTRRRQTGRPPAVPSCSRAPGMPAPSSIDSARSAFAREPKAATCSSTPAALAAGAAAGGGSAAGAGVEATATASPAGAGRGSGTPGRPVATRARR